jgi:TonB family protein
VVKSGDMPLYPPLPRVARIQGDVHLRITTDGAAVASVTVESGQPMLAKAAQENVKTWKFEPHEPTSFPALFSYHLEEELVTHLCDPDVPDNGTVVLKLPREVDITSHARIPDCEQPIDPSRVFLTACEMDGAPVPCEKLEISLKSSLRSVVPIRFKESEQKQGFLVPEDFQSQENFDVSVETGRGKFTVAKLNIGFLKGEWHVGIDHAPFKEGTPVSDQALKAPPGIRCIGFVVFEGEPGVVTYTKCD